MALWDDFREWATDTADRVLYRYSRSAASDAVDAALTVAQKAQTSAANFVETAAQQGGGFVTTVVDEFRKGPPGSPLRSTPEQRDAFEAGARALPGQVAALPEKVTAGVGEGVSRATSVVEFLTRPWVLLLVGGVVVLAVAAPYVVPFLATTRR